MFWTTIGLVESDRWDSQNQAWSHHKCAKPLTHGWMIRTIGIDNRPCNTTAIPSITPSLSRHPLLSAWRNSPSLEPRQIIRSNWSTMLRLDVISSWLDADRSVHHRRTHFRRKQWIPKWNDIWQQQNTQSRESAHQRALHATKNRAQKQAILKNGIRELDWSILEIVTQQIIDTLTFELNLILNQAILFFCQ